MKALSQESYASADASVALDHVPLVIHRRTTGAAPHIILFVHGLGGARYGKEPTWGSLPEFVFEDFADADVGMYEYPTLTSRPRLLSQEVSIKLDTQGVLLSEQLRELINEEGYTSITVVGHSMGGLLSKCAIKELIDSNSTDVLDRIAGLILMATPQIGSLRVPWWAAPFSNDLMAL
jgi:pimeloyl-ACP methyl ester carboxylesterase